MTTCTFPGCTKPAVNGPSQGQTIAGYCASHRSRQRRHGNVHQRTISQAELKPHEEAVKRRVSGCPNARAWPLLDARWTALADYARQSTAHLKPGTLPRTHREAALRAIVDIAAATEARLVWQRIAAFYLLRSHHPGAFADDRGFAFQFVRSLRKLSSASFGRTRAGVTGPTKQWQRDLPPKSTELMGQLITEYLGAAGAYLTDIERKFADREEQQKRDLEAALLELQSRSGD